MKILVIEDEKKSREMLADLLKSNFPQITILGLGKNVAEVVIPSYPTNLPMYLDIRCVSCEYTPKKMFTQPYEKIVENLFKYPKRPYLLGGNCSLPLYEWASWYPPKVQDPYRRMISYLDGVDCSGILYELTLGNLPRNTSDLIHFCENARYFKKFQ